MAGFSSRTGHRYTAILPRFPFFPCEFAKKHAYLIRTYILHPYPFTLKTQFLIHRQLQNVNLLLILLWLPSFLFNLHISLYMCLTFVLFITSTTGSKGGVSQEVGRIFLSKNDSEFAEDKRVGFPI